VRDVHDRVVLLIALLFMAAAFLLTLDAPPAIPTCEEDVVLVGVGNFEDGRYDAYICGPAMDDYDPEA